MSERNAKKARQIQRRFIISLLSNMSFWERIKFVFWGNYYKPLQRTLKKMRSEK